MKKTFLKSAIILFSIIAFIGCSKSDEDVSYNASDLLGEWNLASFNYSGDVKIETNGISVTASSFNGVGRDINTTSIFSENPNKVISEGSYSTEFSLNFNGQTNTNTQEVSSFRDESEWQLNGDILTITNGSLVSVDLPDGADIVDIDQSEAQIIELNSNSLKLRNTAEYETTEDDVTTKVTFNIEMNFTR